MTIVISRKSELARIDAFVAGVPAGARVLLIEGEPGMGKTTLFLAGLERAADRAWRILSARPSDAEATYSYAGIGDLLEAANDDVLAPLPAPQQRALRVALLREEPEGRAPDPGTVAVAVLNVLRSIARAGPMLVAVDDVQWLDSPSALALGFAIRRLRHEPIGILLARRVDEHAGLPLGLDRPFPGEPLARMAVGPLGLAALGEILHGRLEVSFPRSTLHQIHTVSGGNPLFALELGRALSHEPTRLEAGSELPLPGELMSLLGGQLARLPAETQDALAIAAAVAHPTVEVLGQMVDGSEDRWLRPALDAHLVEVDDGRIRFTHPLHAVAARSRTLPHRRREIHRGLASIVAEPEERARHLALAADGPDETVAQALEMAAQRATARSLQAASELAGLARQLTPPERPDDIRRRALREAEYTLFAGDSLRSRALIEDLLPICPAGSARAEALSILGYVQIGLDPRSAVAVLREALAEAGEDDRLRMRCEGLLTGVLDLMGEDVAEALSHGRAELEIATRLGDQVHEATALRGIARNQQRLTGKMPVGLIERSLAREPLVQAARNVAEWPTVCLAEMLSWTDDLAGGLARWEWLRRHAVERGDEVTLGWILSEMVGWECLAGNWQQALDRAEEGRELVLQSADIEQQAAILAGRAFVEVHLGDAEAARRDADEARRLGAPVSALRATRRAAWALGLLELSLGDPARAHDQFGTLVEGCRRAGVGEPGAMRFVPDEIEALIGIGHLGDAEALLGWYEGLANAGGRMHALAACDRCRGLLHAARGELDAAMSALEESRTRYATIADPFGLGRTLLALGSIQRRALHRHEARETLNAALEAFDTLGAELWADRARAELARIGGRRSAGDVLTASERAVASLVAEGHTNREVAAALVLTERTIEGHLSTIYAKLGIRSRSELAHRLPPEPESPQ